MSRAWRWALVLGAHAGIVAGLMVNHGCRTPPPVRPEAPSAAVLPPPPPPPERPPPPPPPPPPLQWPAETEIYVVQPGDSLAKIAARYGVTVTEIATLNGIQKLNLIRVGQKLKIPARPSPGAPKPPAHKPPAAPAAPSAPPTAGTEYRVQPGDTLSAIAHRAGISVTELRQANKLTGDRIFVGQKLIIPGPGKAPKPPAPPPPPPPRPETPPAPRSEPPAAVSPEAPPPEPPAPPPAVPSAPPTPAAPPAVTPAGTPPPAPAAQPSAGTQTFRTYVVQEDEDLYSIAMMWNVSPERLKEVNGLTSMTVKPGDRLKIPISE